MEMAISALSREWSPPELDHNKFEICFMSAGFMRCIGRCSRWLSPTEQHGLRPGDIVKSCVREVGAPFGSLLFELLSVDKLNTGDHFGE
jgi:hypothetical protein